MFNIHFNLRSLKYMHFALAIMCATWYTCTVVVQILVFIRREWLRLRKIQRMLVSVLALIMLVGALSVNTFAAAYSFGNLTASCASQKLVDVTCNYYSLKKDSFTVKNNGTVNMFVYVNKVMVVEIRPGQSYTCPKTHHTKDRVQLYAKSRAIGTKQNIYITSTSGVIYKN